MALENKLGITDSAELARTEETIIEKIADNEIEVHQFKCIYFPS